MTYKYRGTTNATVTAATATRWVIGMASDKVGYAANSDRTSWTFYDMIEGSGDPDAKDIAYGKDGSGNGIYVMARSSTNKELFVSSDNVTTEADWTVVNISGGDRMDMFTVAWSEDSTSSTSGVWFAVGEQDTNKEIYRSTNGAATWSAVDLSGISGHSTTSISSIASDGAGKWAFGQDGRFYHSTNDGVSFAATTPFTADKILGIAYTNSTWVVAYERSSTMYARCAAASDITTWSSETQIDGTAGNFPVPDSGFGRRVTIATHEGKAAFLSHGTGNSNGRIGHCDVSGTTISNMETTAIAGSLSGDGPRDMATDGTTWMVVCVDGDIYESTDSAASWTKTADAVRTGTDDIMCVTPDIHLPR